MAGILIGDLVCSHPGRFTGIGIGKISVFHRIAVHQAPISVGPEAFDYATVSRLLRLIQEVN